MKLLTSSLLICSASAFLTTPSFSPSTSLNAVDRRGFGNAFAAAAATIVAPQITNAAVGESPKFSVFGLLGDGTSYSEGAAYGSDQSSKTYSPYSVYGKASTETFDKTNPEFIARKKAVVKETRVRLEKLPAYIEKTKWFEVKNELTRFMYETRGAIRYLATTPEQKEAAAAFNQSIENVYTNNTKKNGEKTMAAAKDAVEKLDAFSALI